MYKQSVQCQLYKHSVQRTLYQYLNICIHGHAETCSISEFFFLAFIKSYLTCLLLSCHDIFLFFVFFFVFSHMNYITALIFAFFTRSFVTFYSSFFEWVKVGIINFLRRNRDVMKRKNTTQGWGY